jgi:hypothetical protein
MRRYNTPNNVFSPWQLNEKKQFFIRFSHSARDGSTIFSHSKIYDFDLNIDPALFFVEVEIEPFDLNGTVAIIIPICVAILSFFCLLGICLKVRQMDQYDGLIEELESSQSEDLDRSDLQKLNVNIEPEATPEPKNVLSSEQKKAMTNLAFWT